VTRLRSVLLAFAAPVLLALAPAAQGQSSVSVLFGAPGQVVSETSVPVRAEGEIVVAFHGDAAAGCAAVGLCPYSGTILVRPGSGALGLITYRQHGRIERQASLFLTPGPTQYSAAANVDRLIPGQPPGTCADTESNSFGSPTASVHGGLVTVRMFDIHGDTLSTRCAGPLDGDLTGVGPTATIPLKRLLRGHTTVDLSGTDSFASHGFAGTVSSTVVLIFGKPAKNSNTQPKFPPGIKTTRVRTVSEQLTLTRMTGELTATVQGVANPLVCRLLDSCGLTGTIAFGQARDFNGTVLATGPADRPYGDFLAALGLSAGNPHGISVGVSGDWAQGPATAKLAQSGATCTDSAPGGAMFMNLTSGGGVLTGFAGTTSWRTRCPGPILNSQGNPLLAASVPRDALRHRTFTIGLRPSRPVEDDGYTLTVQGHMSLTVRGGRITQHVITQPAG
jgi:hypothetical protein